MTGAAQLAICRWAVLGTLVLAIATGCSRTHFRNRADRDVEGVISQKNLFPEWKVENWHVYPDPRSRFADPPGSCPDFPPYPPDDYAAWLTSPNPQKPGRGGAGRYEGEGYLHYLTAWDAQNRAEQAQREQEIAAARVPGDREEEDLSRVKSASELASVAGGAAAYLLVFATDERPYRIKLNQAVELALFNSREFQDRREDLYLAALPVTLERFSFAAQAFAAEQLIRESLGREVAGGPAERWRINTDVGVTRRFATGGELIVRLANQIVVDLTGPNPEVSLSNLSLTFIQPLLRGGGFAVTLEALTQAERTLVYAIRSYARFRRVFYVAIAGQGDYTNNPYGLQGLSTNLGRGIGANLTARPTGFLPTILQSARLANERLNIAALEEFLRLFRNLREGGGVNELQVVRVEQNLIRSRNTLINNTRQYLDNLDFFKLQLGIPATIPIELDESPLQPIREHLRRFDQVFAQLRQLEQAAGQFDPKEAPADYRQRWYRLLTESSLVRGTRFAQEYIKQAEALRQMTEDDLARRLAELLAQRRKLLDARAERELKRLEETPEQLADLAAVDTAIDRARFEQALRQYESQPWLRVPPERRAGAQAVVFRQAFEFGMLVAIQPRNQRLEQLRVTWPKLAPLQADGVDLLAVPYDEATAKVAQVALVNRLDLMNARAQVVDSWRQLTVQANSLLGSFDVRYDLQSATPGTGTNGLAFSGPRTSHTVTMRVEPPLVRRAERNQYRAALIGYQRSRRNLMAFEDNILTDARANLRQLRQLAESYALQQRSLDLAYLQVEDARSTFLAPPDPTSTRGAAGEAAALTQQLLEAQSSLLQAQNELFTTWVNYLNVRMNLFLDLELLPVDARGLWTDEPPPNAIPDLRPPDAGQPGSLPERAPDPQPQPGR